LHDPAKPLPFAKISEVDGHQVLFFIARDDDADEDDRFVVHQMTETSAAFVDFKLCNLREESARKIFDGITDDYARNIRFKVLEVTRFVDEADDAG